MISRVYEYFARCFQLPLELHDSAYANFIAWEKLRILYNGVLVAIALGGLFIALITTRNIITLIAFIPLCVAGAIGANLAYCLGPVAEGYAVMFRINRMFARGILFTLGLGLASSAAILCVLTICISGGLAD